MSLQTRLDECPAAPRDLFLASCTWGARRTCDEEFGWRSCPQCLRRPLPLPWRCGEAREAAVMSNTQSCEQLVQSVKLLGHHRMFANPRKEWRQCNKPNRPGTSPQQQKLAKHAAFSTKATTERSVHLQNGRQRPKKVLYNRQGRWLVDRDRYTTNHTDRRPKKGAYSLWTRRNGHQIQIEHIHAKVWQAGARVSSRKRRAERAYHVGWAPSFSREASKNRASAGA